MPEWFFREKSRAEISQDPVQNEFFTQEGVCDALVRETIQNSLDAVIQPPGSPVKVLFNFAGLKNNISLMEMNKYYNKLEPHLQATFNSTFFQDRAGCIPFISIEDFGTQGLTGDVKQDEDYHGKAEKNNFFYFWRNIARSAKSETDRGRWGVGKTVFPASSRINTFYGLTKRIEDDKLYLMGQSILRLHEIDEKWYVPYGYYSNFEEDGFAIPIDDSKLIADFKKVFKLKRGTESGLSIVIPFPQEDVISNKVLESVVLHYFFPILSNTLVVDIITESGDLVSVTSESIDAITMNLHFEDSRKFKENLPELFRFTKWCINLDPNEYFKMKLSDTFRWEEEIVSSEDLEELRSRFENYNSIAIRVPITIQKRNQRGVQTYFDVFLEKDKSLDFPQEFYIRQGLTISGIEKLNRPGVRGIVMVEDNRLSTFLGDSENPAHTNWEERSSRIKNNYEKPVPRIRFIKNSLKGLSTLLSQKLTGLDEDLLKDIFNLEKLACPDKPESGSLRKLNIEAGEPSLVISKYKNGFSVKKNDKYNQNVYRIVIEVAYNTLRGNPFKAYSPYDFSFYNDGIETKYSSGVYNFIKKANRIECDISLQDFQITITGFDPHREICINAQPVVE